MFMAGYEDEGAFDAFMRGFDLRGAVASLKCPTLIVAGEMDQLSPIRNTYELTRRMPGPVELVVYQNELHAIGKASSAQLGPHWYALMADWLAARVRDARPQTARRFVFITSSGATEERPMP
jgi:alpha-beta hydrolase superfamily lysophospholipase